MHNLRNSQVFDIFWYTVLPRCFNISRFPSCLQRLGSHISNQVFSSNPIPVDSICQAPRPDMVP